MIRPAYRPIAADAAASPQFTGGAQPSPHPPQSIFVTAASHEPGTESHEQGGSLMNLGWAITLISAASCSREPGTVTGANRTGRGSGVTDEPKDEAADAVDLASRLQFGLKHCSEAETDR